MKVKVEIEYFIRKLLRSLIIFVIKKAIFLTNTNNHFRQKTNISLDNYCIAD